MIRLIIERYGTAIAGLALDLDRLHVGQRRNDHLGRERSVHRIARQGMGRLELKHRPCRQPIAAAAQPDPCVGRTAQPRPDVGSGGRGHSRAAA